MKHWSAGRWRSFGRAIALLAFACALAVGIPYGAYLYYQHLVNQGYFEPHDIQIRGNLRVSDAEILEVSGLLDEGVNLFDLDSDALRERLEGIAWVDSVDLNFTLPDAIEIVVREKEALGIVNDGNLYVVDLAGEPIKLYAVEDALTHPIVSGRGLLERGDVVKQAFALARAVEGADFAQRVDEVHYDNATGYTLFTAQSEIRMGYDRFDERIERLMQVDEILASQSVVADYILLDADKDLDAVAISARPDAAAMARKAAETEDVAALLKDLQNKEDFDGATTQ